MTAEQQATRLPPAEAWEAPLPPRPDLAAVPAPDPAMTPERHAAILRSAARTGSWEAAEIATRTMAAQAMRAAMGRLLRRLWRR
ncbi:hypothetical protein [Falsiroseomonas sp. E2-1-a20]|uniref:hypothetical protein n=1 Tax=Falsiroseomonas sp. E2-1-a20 TaxID=3239300 RepID=UPI003F3390C7